MHTGHIINIGNLTFCVNSVTVSYLIHYHSLLQNATDIITKSDSYFIIKLDICYKLRRFYFKMRQLLQNATFIPNIFSTSIICLKIFWGYFICIIYLKKQINTLFYSYKILFNKNVKTEAQKIGLIRKLFYFLKSKIRFSSQIIYLKVH